MIRNPKSLEDKVHNEQELEQYCDYCGLPMKLIKFRSKKNRWEKPHAKHVCDCGNEFRVRSINEILRDLQIKE